MNVMKKIGYVILLAMAVGFCINWASTGNPITDWRNQSDVDEWNTKLASDNNATFTRTVSYDKEINQVRFEIKRNDLSKEEASMGALFLGAITEKLKNEFISGATENTYMRILLMRDVKVRIVLQANDGSQFATIVLTKEDL